LASKVAGAIQKIKQKKRKGQDTESFFDMNIMEKMVHDELI
jgi:hypothetical protein